MAVSRADRVVVAASQTLVSASSEHLSFEEIKARLELVRKRLDNESAPTAIDEAVSRQNLREPDLLPTS
jgi:hypothetical protein